MDKITLQQKQFITDRLEHDYRIPNLEDATLNGLLQTWTTALANGWLSLADLSRKQIEKLLRDMP
jgi:hypothetical protein